MLHKDIYLLYSVRQFEEVFSVKQYYQEIESDLQMEERCCAKHHLPSEEKKNKLNLLNSVPM
jgi:hypothetical protein